MKAKKLAETIVMAGDKPLAMQIVVKEFESQWIGLLKSRNAQSEEAVINILRDMDRKWTNFAYIVNSNMKKLGYEEFTVDYNGMRIIVADSGVHKFVEYYDKARKLNK